MAQIKGIDLNQYKKQAKERLKELGQGKLADAQRVIAHENGFPSWPKFRVHLLFRNAVRALDKGDLPTLKTLLDQTPSLTQYQCRTGEWYEQGYFSGATLLHHIAGNPDRGPIPENILEIAQLLITRGFDPKAADYTVGLLLTSRRASESGVALPLIDLLIKAGANFDGDAANLLDMPLLNLAPETAKALLNRGARLEMRHAAALGDLEALEQKFDPAQLEESLAYACIRGQKQAVAFLLNRGAKGDVLVTPGRQTPRTALHEAANRGYNEIVNLLLENGARADVVEPRWHGTPAGWAEHGGHPELAALLNARGESGRCDPASTG
jgi:hypothetical protein